MADPGRVGQLDTQEVTQAADLARSMLEMENAQDAHRPKLLKALDGYQKELTARKFVTTVDTVIREQPNNGGLHCQ